MGDGRWDSKKWDSYATDKVHSKKTVDAIYTARNIEKDLNPKGIKMRESCDSIDNPNSTAIVVALDVTGSMGRLSEVMARKGLKTLAEEIYNRKPISDPHIMFMGIGDAEMGDKAPLQVTQFEADIRIAEQLQKLYLEGGGGGNKYESYILAWYFLAFHSKIDCFEKRSKKGYVFTVGDERPTPYLYADDIQRVFGYRPQFEKISAEDLLDIVSRQYEVFHLIVEEGGGFRSDNYEVTKKWNALLGQKAIHLADHTKMSEVIVSTLQVVNGEDIDTVSKSWNGDTSIVINKAIGDLSILSKNNSELVTF